MLLMVAKKKQSETLLSLRNQKPKKKNSNKNSFFKRHLWLVSLLVISGVGSFFIFKYSIELLDSWQTKPSVAETKKPWLVEYKFPTSSNNTLPMKEAAQIINQNIGSANYGNLLNVSKLIQKKLQAEQVSIVRTGEHQLTVSLQERKPMLRIAADQVRLVSSSEQVYGSAVKQPEAAELPVLNGVFNPEVQDFNIREDQTLELDEQERTIIHDALTLSKEAGTHGFKIEEIEYVKYRGFLLRTKNDNIEITIGMPPFKQRLKQLSEILNNLKKSGTQVVRIELDYNGKAFIKQKEL